MIVYLNLRLTNWHVVAITLILRLSTLNFSLLYYSNRLGEDKGKGRGVFVGGK